MTLNAFLPADIKKRKWVAIGVTIVISILLTLWGIYGFGRYGIALFILTPLFMGASPTILYGNQKGLNFGVCCILGLLTLGIYGLLLILFAIEGLICIIMAFPIAAFLNIAGCAIGYAIVTNMPKSSSMTIVILLFAIPLTGFVERDAQPELTSVVTSTEVDASPATVWKNLVEFSALEQPTELIFKAGIAYPTDAQIDGTGVGAVRHCNFTTGSFVEPITVWDEPRLLKFSVKEYPQPMRELSFWDINAPHLHDYFVSKQGQFKLTELPNGKTLLEGTTWYYHDIKPAVYWKFWSNYIVHKIHDRVLTHIKRNSEKQSQPPAGPKM